jgi:NDP-hexose C3-ketoreductase / dTDP-4-oxo-2-deoxy-alpha-D-pentos-2-ene 2,3-reductase
LRPFARHSGHLAAAWRPAAAAISRRPFGPARPASRPAAPEWPNFAGWHIAQAQEAAGHQQMFGLVSEQSLYNLAARTVELEVLPACQGYGLGVLPWSPLHGGLLGGILGKEKGGRSAGGRAAEALAVPGLRTQIETYEAFCAQLGADPADVGLAWLLHQPAVTAPIIGPRTPAQLDGAVRALELTLDETALGALDKIFPGPGGAAPEAYAW